MDANNSSIALECAVALAFLLFAGAFWCVSLVGQWSLAPLERNASVTTIVDRLRTQLSLGEILLLLVQVQVAAAVGLQFGWHGDIRPLIVSAVASLAVVATWLASVRRLAASGVVCRHRRVVFLAIVAPLVCAAIAAGLWFNGNAVFQIVATGNFAILPWLAGNLAAMGAFLACRRATLWVLSAAS